MTYPRNRSVRSDVRVERRRTVPRPLVYLLGTVVALVAGVLALVLSHQGGVLPGVTVAGVDASGMSRQALATAVEPVVADVTADPVQLTHGDETLDVVPAAAGFVPTVDATVEAAWGHGRTGNLVERSWAHVAALWQTVDVPVQGSVDATAMEATLDEIETTVAAEPFPGGISADPETLEVAVEAPARGFELDRDALQDDLLAAFAAPGVETLEAPGSFVSPPTTLADVEAVAVQAQAALQQPFEASIPVIDDVVTLTPRDLAPLLTAALDGDQLVLAVDPTLVGEAFGQRVDLFDVAPRDASWDLPRAPVETLDTKGDVTWSPVAVEASVVASKSGRAFDNEAVAEQMAGVLASGEHRADFDLPVVEPEFSTEDAREFGVTELIGTFTTYHAPGQPRVTNIQKLADVIDGTRVGPGEQFSINELSGERTCDKGYVEDKMILNHKLVDVCGGGVSQFGTTMMNAAFFAGVQIDDFKAHSHYIDRYPMGREATLNYPSPDIDVRWTNDTGHGIYIRTSYTDTSITVSLYGTTDATEISATHSAPFRERNSTTEYVENRSLAPGSSRVVEKGIDGFDIEFTRTIHRGDGDVTTEDFLTRYVAIPTVIERNTAKPKPEPEPTESESSAPKPKDDAGTEPKKQEPTEEPSKTDDGASEPAPKPTP